MHWRTHPAPADWFTDGCEEILRLLRYRGEGFQNNVAVLRADPEWPGGMIRLQVQP